MYEKLVDLKTDYNHKSHKYFATATYEVDDGRTVQEKTYKNVDLSTIFPTDHLPFTDVSVYENHSLCPRVCVSISGIEDIPVEVIEQRVVFTHAKKMTIEEIEKILGHKVKIVSKKD